MDLPARVLEHGFHLGAAPAASHRATAALMTTARPRASNLADTFSPFGDKPATETVIPATWYRGRCGVEREQVRELGVRLLGLEGE